MKELEFVTEEAELVSYQVKPNYRTLGPRFGKEMPQVAAAVEALDPDARCRGGRRARGRASTSTATSTRSRPEDMTLVDGAARRLRGRVGGRPRRRAGARARRRAEPRGARARGRARRPERPQGGRASRSPTGSRWRSTATTSCCSPPREPTRTTSRGETLATERRVRRSARRGPRSIDGRELQIFVEPRSWMTEQPPQLRLAPPRGPAARTAPSRTSSRPRSGSEPCSAEGLRRPRHRVGDAGGRPRPSARPSEPSYQWMWMTGMRHPATTWRLLRA